MSRPKRSLKKAPIIENSDSKDESPGKKLKLSSETKNIPNKNDNESSSDSDIENYLQPIDKLDFSSSFFNLKKSEKQFDNIEKSIFDGVKQLSDSESDQQENENEGQLPKEYENKDKEKAVPELNFKQLEDFTKTIEEAKLQVEKYNAKKKIREKNQDISNILAAGEGKQLTLENIQEEDLHPSDFETTDDEWEEVKVKDAPEEKSIIPKENIEIRVGDMPDHVKKKKGIDLLSAMKRRLNRIRKENQIYVHKVHLLCWIAHGNFLNSVINNSDILSQALSLLPSDKSYPSDRPDLGYLEQIVQWYKKSIRLTEKPPPQELTLINSLKLQMKRKDVFTKSNFVLIFIAILRALGLQCRLVLSFQVEPLQPPSSELHSLSTNENDKTKNTKSSSKSGESSLGSKNSKVVVTKAKRKQDLNSSKLNSTANTVNSSKNILSNRVHKNKSKEPSNKKPNLTKLKTSHNFTKEDIFTKKELEETNENNYSSKKRGKVSTSSSKETKKEEISDSCTQKTAKRNRVSSRKTVKNDQLGCITNEVEKEDIKERTTKRQARTMNVNRSDTRNGTKDSEKKSVTKTTKNILAVEENKPRSKSVDKVTTTTSKNTLSVQENKPRSKSEDKRKSSSNQTTKNTLTVEEKKTRTKSNSSNKSSHTAKTTKSTKSIIKIKLPTTRNKKSEEKEVPQLDGANDENKPKRIVKRDKPNLNKLKSKPSEKICTSKNHARHITSSFNDDDSENEFSSSPSKKLDQNKINFSKLAKETPSSSFSNQLDVKSDIINLIKGRISEQKVVDRQQLANKRKSETNNYDSDSDYMPEPPKKKHHSSDSDIEYFLPKPKIKKRIRVKKEGDKLKVLSSDDEQEKKKKKGIDIWLEVFLESEEKWITADVVRGQVHCVNEIFTRASRPVSYVVAWNNDCTLKDVTMRYCKNFNTVTRKLRTEPKWWRETLIPFLEKSTPRSKEEDNDLNRQQLDQPLPTIISEYKNHPLYALKRHLLKFEAIHPPDIIPLGYVRGEPVYPRKSVYVCRSREIWLKEARVVKPMETSYKVVKARPKYDKLSNKVVTGQLLELFGIWQTTEYEPPTAENGIVPRNAYGNVELFKACMLPKGTVQLRLPGLNKICRKLNIDCASAVVGFDFHGGWSHPVYDGFVLCKEYEDTCIAAWHQEQEEIERKETEKIEKRVYTNWKKLIKGLFIREKLKARYDFGEASTGGKGKKKPSGS